MRRIATTTVAIAVLLAGMAPPPPVSAAEPAATPGPDAQLVERLDPQRISYHGATGWVRFLGGGRAEPLRTAGAQASPLTAVRAFVGTYGSLFGLEDPTAELRVRSVVEPVDGLSVVRLDQQYQDVPVIAGELAAQVDASGAVLAVSGEISPNLELDVTPLVSAQEATTAAIAATAEANDVARSVLEADQPTLAIYDARLLGGPGIPVPRLVWRTEVGTADGISVHDFVAVDARTGGIALRFGESRTALDRRICDHNNVRSTLPCTGSYVRVEGGPPSGIADADLAYDYLGDVYAFYSSQFGRDSLDGAGQPLVTTVRWCNTTLTSSCPWPNAGWVDSQEQMVFGAGMVIDDVTGHEMTHGVTAHESGLRYYYQSGAIDEAISDTFGEFIDQGNVRGNDSPGVRWLIGEDDPNGITRNMADPPAYNQPDRMTSALYHSAMDDNGGVHYNSGVADKATFLMTDGGTFNGHVVGALGMVKTARVFYVAATTLLTSGSDYADLYDDLQQACIASIGTVGITSGDCAQVLEAVAATEMNLQPVTGAAVPDAPVCSAGQVVQDLFLDSFETGTSNWSFGAVSGIWHVWSRGGSYATTGTYDLWGEDVNVTTDSYSVMKTGITLPAGQSYLRFTHAYEFEPGTSHDGGVVEYSANGGAWQDASPLFLENPYNGTVAALGGRAGFTGGSYGYTSSRLALASLAGETLKVRFRIGTDSGTAAEGWHIDDVRIYTCIAPSAPGAPTGVIAVRGNASATVSWTAPASNGGHLITAYNVTAAPGGRTCSTTGALSCAVSGLTNGTPYTFTVTATNSIGTGPASAPSAAVTPATVPGVPTGVIAVAANTSASVSWTAPADSGGLAISSYTVTAAPGGRTCATTGALSCTVTGLANGTSYTFTVRAANDVGPGPASDPSSAVTPAPGVPGAPTGVKGVAKDASALVSWSAPTDNGGAAITAYAVTSNPGALTCGTSGALSCTVAGLTNGTPYTFTVAATNVAGTGPASAASSPVTPSAAPPVPATASITALPRWVATPTVALRWGATPGTAPVASYDVRYRRAAWRGGFGSTTTWSSETTATSASFPASAGYTYCFSILARDTLGLVSAPSAETCTAVPLDDRSLSRSSGWSTGTGSAYYRSTYLRSSTHGAKLTRTGTVAKQIAILATTCSRCGTIRVYWGSKLLKTISLRSTTTVNRKLITVTTFTSARSGTLSIRVYSSGKKVIIDGVAIRRN